MLFKCVITIKNPNSFVIYMLLIIIIIRLLLMEKGAFVEIAHITLFNNRLIDVRILKKKTSSKTCCFIV